MSRDGERGHDTDLPILPRGWDWVPLEKLAADEPRAITDGPFGSHLKSEHYTEAGPRVIRLQNVGDGVFLDARAHVSRQRFEALQAHEARPGDVVVASLGESLPRACVVPEGLGPAIVKADCPRIRPSGAVTSRFLMHALNSPPVRRQAKRAIHGVGRPRLNLGELKKLLIPVAPRSEQDGVVARVDGGLGRLLEAQHRFEAARALLTDLRRAVISCELGWDAGRDGWRLVVPSEIARKEPHALAIGPFGSNLKVSDYTEVGVPLVFVRSIRQRSFPGPRPQFVSPDKAQELAAHTVVGGDVLVTKMGDPPGDAAIYPKSAAPAVITADCIRFAVDERLVVPRLVALSFETDFVRAQIAERVQGVAQQKISLRSFRTIEFPLPPRHVQVDLLARLDQQLSAIDDFSATLESSLDRVEDVRASLLNAVFGGLASAPYVGDVSSGGRVHALPMGPER